MMEGIAYLQDGRGKSHMGDSSWLVHKSAWRSYRDESAKIDVVAK